MERRSFLKKAGVGLAAGAAAGVASTTAVAAPAVQTGLPEIKWRMTSSFPKSIDTLYGSAELLTNRLREITGGDKLDAGPMIEYFTPVNAWLKEQNQGQVCGWQASAAAPAAPAAPAQR